MKYLRVFVTILFVGILFNTTTSYADSKELFKAVTNGDISTVKALLDRGANVNAVEEKYGITPLHMAAYQGNMELVQLLLDRGANINAKDKEGEAPLHSASNNGQLQVVKLLINKGADINSRTNHGWTPLHYAAAIGSKEVAAILISRGANIKVRANDGKTTLDWAATKGHKEVVELLKSHSGNLEEKQTKTSPRTSKTENDKTSQNAKEFSSGLFDGFFDSYRIAWLWVFKTLKPSSLKAKIAYDERKHLISGRWSQGAFLYKIGIFVSFLLILGLVYKITGGK